MTIVYARDIPPYEYHLLPTDGLRSEIRRDLGRETRKCDLYCQGLLPDRLHPERITVSERHTESSRRVSRNSISASPLDNKADEFVDDKIEWLLRGLNYREREITKLRNGFGDGFTYTLEEVGRIFGRTRERIRQIEKRALQKLRRRLLRAGPFAQQLEEVLDFVAAELPAPAHEIETKLATKGITKSKLPLETLSWAATLVGQRARFAVQFVNGKRMALPLEAERLTRWIIHVATRSVAHYGVATIAEISAQVGLRFSCLATPDFVARVLTARPDFQWLEEKSGWFWLCSITKNRVLSRVRKILAVAERIHVSELRTGIARHHLMKGYAPPRRVLLELCRQLPEYRVENNFVIADTALDWRRILGGTELSMVTVLKEHGPVMQRAKFEEMCIALGIKRSTFYVYLDYSPLLERFAPGVYGLRGATVPPGVIEALAPERHATKVLVDHGWKPDGRIWITYCLSDAMIANGVCSIPAAMKRFLEGAHVLKVADGISVGTLMVKNNGAWGLGPFFRRRGGEAGDSLTIVFDLSAKNAFVYIGHESSLEDTDCLNGRSAVISD